MDLKNYFEKDSDDEVSEEEASDYDDTEDEDVEEDDIENLLEVLANPDVEIVPIPTDPITYEATEGKPWHEVPPPPEHEPDFKEEPLMSRLSDIHCHLCFSRSRYMALVKCLRFDDFENRAKTENNQNLDKLCPINEVFDPIIASFKKMLLPGGYICLDENLLGFRGRVAFKMFLPSKPKKFGIKIFLLADVSTGYCWNAKIYTGKDSAEKSDEPLGVKKNQVKFLFRQFETLVLFQAKDSKMVTLYSTQFHSQGKLIATGKTHPNQNKVLPEAINLYNKTKCTVDIINQQEDDYSYDIVTCRWPLKVFLWLLNMVGLNSYILFKVHMERQGLNSNFDPSMRKLFLHNLSMQMMEDQIEYYSYSKILVTKTFRAIYDSMKILYLKVRGKSGEGGFWWCNSDEKAHSIRTTVEPCMGLMCKKKLCPQHTTQVAFCSKHAEDYIEWRNKKAVEMGQQMEIDSPVQDLKLENPIQCQVCKVERVKMGRSKKADTRCAECKKPMCKDCKSSANDHYCYICAEE
uniref:PiggyBac transposable element-derived protein domain-containing protein n=1 Tax=Acrobeloides nanus TaxID=290746 RepID=A0A914D081_9BILA